jgi:hypothetical protein
MRRFIAFSAVALAAAALAACGDAGTGSTTCPSYPTLGLPQLLYPIPGATGVPDSPQYLVVTNVGPASGSLYLIPPNGGNNIAAQALGPVPSPAPSPAATAPANATVLAAAIPNLNTGTYTVKFVSNGASPCVQGQQSGTIGSFSTQ